MKPKSYKRERNSIWLTEKVLVVSVFPVAVLYLSIYYADSFLLFLVTFIPSSHYFIKTFWKLLWCKCDV